MSQGVSAADQAHLIALLAEAGRAIVMPRFRALGAETVRTKTGPLDLVTDADEAAERFITEALTARFPGCLVVGEEATAADPGRLDRMRAARLVFVLDPIDGTANYAAGLPLFATMAAAIVEGRLAAAVIHDPVTRESCAARAGQGAWQIAPDGTTRRLAVAPPAAPAAMTGTLSWRYLPHNERELVMRGMLGLAGVYDFRCAGHQYRLLANGQLHFSLYNRLLPWDHAPGYLIHAEAGGYGARFDGSPYSPFLATGGLICAPDKAGFDALRDALLR